MLDETALESILERHFADASAGQRRRAAHDILLLQLLTDDALEIAWEDRMQDAHAAAFTLFSSEAHRVT